MTAHRPDRGAPLVIHDADPGARLRDTLLDDGYPTAEVDLIVARYEEWLNRARDAS